jgi:hypothetical protein
MASTRWRVRELCCSTTYASYEHISQCINVKISGTYNYHRGLKGEVRVAHIFLKERVFVSIKSAGGLKLFAGYVWRPGCIHTCALIWLGVVTRRVADHCASKRCSGRAVGGAHCFYSWVRPHPRHVVYLDTVVMCL